MNTVQIRLFFMAFAAFCTLALAQNAPQLAINEKTVVKQGVGKLAVLRPKTAKAIDEETVETIWSTLESLVAKQRIYTVILRNDKDLGGLIKEIGFQGTHLVDKNGKKILPGKIKAVDTLLCCSIGQLGNTWTFDLKIVNAETATINPKYNVHNTFKSIDDIADSLEAQVQLLFKDKEEIKDVMLMEPVCAEGVKVSGEGFVAAVKHEIFDRVKVSNTEPKAILAQMKKKDISEMLDLDWPRFRRLSNVRYLLVPRITCWVLKEERIPNSYNGNIRAVCNLEAECEMLLMDTRDGSIKSRIQLKEDINNEEMVEAGRPMTVQEFKVKCREMVFKQWSSEATDKLAASISELKAFENN
ncbi:MAG: hypothetical protein IJS08_05575 [Victivallales bacterium]|nr:hypothetical protein [Victivallales bacterium]